MALRADSGVVARNYIDLRRGQFRGEGAKCFRLCSRRAADYSQGAALHVAVALQSFYEFPVEAFAVGFLHELEITDAGVRPRRADHGTPGKGSGDTRGNEPPAIYSIL